MRIDFKGRFEDVLKLTKTAVAPRGAAQGFERLLSDVFSHKASDGAEKTVKSSATEKGAGPAASSSGPMAMLRPEPPKLELPSLAPEPAPAPAEPESVKAPVIVGANRLAPRTMVVTDEDFQRIVGGIEEWGKKVQVDPALSKAVAESESAFDPSAVSADGHGSKGLFQLLDKTGQQYHQSLGIPGEYDPFDVEQNTQIGVSYLRHLHDIFSQPTTLRPGLNTISAANSASLEKLAVAAFNAGEGRVASAQQAAQRAGRDPGEYTAVSSYLPTITQNYVERVMESRARFLTDGEAV